MHKFLQMVALLCGLGLSVSCTDSLNEENKVAQDELIQGWLSLHISLPMFQGTRAGVQDVVNYGTYAGTTDEQKVTSARVVLYDAAGLAVYSFDVVSAAAEILQGRYATEFTLKARKFQKDRYSVLVLLNPTDAVKAVTNKGNVKTQFEAVANVNMGSLVSSAKGIFMCNAYGYVNTTEGNWKSTQAEAEAGNAPLEIKVERAVAKVFVGPAAGVSIEAPTASSAKLVNFGLDIINKKMYWMRKPNRALTGNGTTTTDAPTGTETAATPRKYQYAIDPNMGSFTAKNTTEFWYYNENNAYTTSTGGWDDSKGIYVPENTSDAANQRGMSTTRVLINAQFLPKELTFPTADKTWVNYKGKLMTLQQLKDKATASETAASDDAIKMPTGFKADMAALKRQGIALANTTASFDKQNLKFYRNGENYYSTYIRHFDNQTQPKTNAYGRYGLVRNHIYKIQINRITGPGSPVPEEPTNGGNDLVETFIQATITVVPWNTRTTTIDLE